MTELSALVLAHYHAWACSYSHRRWRAIGTTPDGRQIVTAATDSPEDALRALLEAA